jgi:WD40 repeat protein
MQVLQASKKGVRCVAFSPDGDALAAGSYDGAVRLWNTADGTHRKLTSGGYTPRCLVWTPDGTRVAGTAGPDYAGSLFWCSTDGEVSVVAEGEVGGCCLSPDGAVLYAATRDGICRWEVRTGEDLAMWPARSPAYLAASADGKWLASTHPLVVSDSRSRESHHVAVWDVRTGDVAKRIEWPSEFTAAVAFSPDATRLAVVKTQSLSVWEWPSGRVVREHRSKKFLNGLAFSPDGRTLATAGNDGVVRFWDPATGDLRTEFDWVLGKALCVAFAPDGLRAAAGGESGRIAVWDVG